VQSAKRAGAEKHRHSFILSGGNSPAASWPQPRREGGNALHAAAQQVAYVACVGVDAISLTSEIVNFGYIVCVNI